MSKIKRLTSDQRADLVAYLDGELPEDRTRSIEQTLAESDVARHEVEMFSRTWELLDELPRETASAGFTAKTLATAKVEAVGGEPVWGPRINRAMVGLGWTCWLAAAAVLGFTVGRHWIAGESDRYLRDLSVLENFDSYREVGSAEFLRQLENAGLPPEPASPAGGAAR